MIFIDLSHESGGLGDIISQIPALRAFRKLHPTEEIVVITYSQHSAIFKYCPHIDKTLAVDRVPNVKQLLKNYNVVDPVHSFFEHHQEHIVKSNIKYLAGSTEGHSLEYDLSFPKEHENQLEEYKKELLHYSQGRPIVGISPCVTMYSRMWTEQQWAKLSKLLQKNGYFVVALGRKEDLNINVDFDGKDKYPIHFIPKLLDIFDSVFVVNSGMLHVAGINQNVHIIQINIGQFPPEVITPYRNGVWAYNTTIINHNCAYAQQCYENHLNESAINRDIITFSDNWKLDTGKELNDPYFLKYICWNYCFKGQNKYSCSDIPAEEVFKAFSERKSTIVEVADKEMPIFHKRQKSCFDDYLTWKKEILL